MNAENYCRDKAAPPGSGFYYASLFYEPDTRQDLCSLYAFLTEIEDVITECTDPGIARIKLAWWEEELGRAAAGEARHPVGQAISKLVRKGPVDESRLRTFIETTGSQLSHTRFDSYDEILSFYSQGSGLIWETIAGRCGANEQSSIAAANRIGCLLRYFDNLQSSRTLLNNQQFLSPQNDLAQFNLEMADLLQPQQENVAAYFAQQIDRLVADLQQSSRMIASADRRAMLLVIILARITIRTCEEIRRSGCQLTRQKVFLTPLRKLWIAWSTRIMH